MKVHTTNYINTFIEAADDCRAASGEIPPTKKGAETIANMEYDMVKKHPYQYTSDEVLFQVFALQNDLTKEEMPVARKEFFSKGQACFRASPLTKRYGWGVHCNEESKMAIYGIETAEYQKFLQDKNIAKVKAMRSKR
ncbi:MAG: hypothetical protein EPN37_16220 [Chitinophagaceae bacterium]|nr:MAG: hypothetical protein EPN37_16220 [Chitinophagaceae bacterium]